MNNQEREAFYAYGEAIGIPRLMQTCGEYHAFQAGAAYQRTQAQPADALVEALESATEWLEYSDNTHGYCCCGMRMDTHETPMNAGHVPVDAGEYHSGLLIAQCHEALDTYRAAQEKPHD